MMRNATIFTTILIAILILSTTTAVAEEQVYRWTDENGVVHFSSQPNDQSNAEIVELQKAPPGSEPAFTTPESAQEGDTEPSYAQQLREERAQKQREAQQQKKEIDALCESHLLVVIQLEPMTRVLYEQPDGSVVRMDDNERLERLHESKSFIAENCNK